MTDLPISFLLKMCGCLVLLEKNQTTGVCPPVPLESQTSYSHLAGPPPPLLQPFRKPQTLSSEFVLFYVHIRSCCLLGFALGGPFCSCHILHFPFLVLMPIFLFFLHRSQICLTCHDHCPHLPSGFWATLPVSVCSLSRHLVFEYSQRALSTLGCHNSSGTLEHAEYIFLGHVATLPSQLLPVAPNMVLLFPLWSPFSLGLDVGSPLALFLPILSLSVPPQISLLPSGGAWRLASLPIVTLS